jgi:hypothetical protein
MQDIVNFYKENKLDENFNQIYYANRFPETKEFYQPYCKENKIDEAE